MTTIPRQLIDDYTSQLNGLLNATQQAIAKQLENITYSSVEDLRIQLIDLFEPYLGAATDTAAAYAAEFYDELRERAVGARLGAQAVSMRVPESTVGAIRAILKRVDDGASLDQISQQLLDRVDYEIKRSAGDCVKENARLDPLSVKYARVPAGAETCSLCIMLASRGFVYSSKKSAGEEKGHYHANCDCRIVPGFDGMDVEGYDPDDLYRRYKDQYPQTNN